jgi:hypothetical protein
LISGEHERARQIDHSGTASDPSGEKFATIAGFPARSNTAWIEIEYRGRPWAAAGRDWAEARR